jgi:hypothetical protein
MKNVYVKLNPVSLGKNSFQREDHIYQKTALKCKEQTGKMLYLDQSFSESKPEVC